jgi:hypothetical protein
MTELISTNHLHQQEQHYLCMHGEKRRGEIFGVVVDDL